MGIFTRPRPLLWLFTFLFNVNHTSSEKNASFRISIMSNNESVIKDFSLYRTVSFYTAMLIRDNFYKTFNYIFSTIQTFLQHCKWIILAQQKIFITCNELLWDATHNWARVSASSTDKMMQLSANTPRLRELTFPPSLGDQLKINLHSPYIALLHVS